MPAGLKYVEYTIQISKPISFGIKLSKSLKYLHFQFWP